MKNKPDTNHKLKGGGMLENSQNIKVYEIKNLNEHINKFINIQESEATKENYKILLENFYNYSMENQLKAININNATIIIKEYKAYVPSRTNT